MSQKNVEIAKRMVAAFNQRDIDFFMQATTSDFEWFPALSAVEGEVFRGREGIDTYWGRLDEAWEDYRLVADEYRDLGDSVLILGRMVGRGRGSGVRSRRQWGRSATIEMASAGASAPISITARRCGRRAWPSRAQVPVSGAM